MDPISLEDIERAIKESKNDSSTGMDNIHNRMLKNLPKNTLLSIKHLFNLCLRENKIPQTWKSAKITMIPKKDSSKTNPNNYRPISVTSCLGKILERIITTRLVAHLELNNLLADFQFGFRRRRRTTDNLLFLSQKIIESFNRKKRFVRYFLIFQKPLIKFGMKASFIN